MEIKGNMIIGFKKVRGNNEVVIKANNPLTGLDIEPEYATASIVHVQKVCELAWSAFKEYRHSTAHERADFLNTIASNIENLGEVLIDRAMLETGLPKVRLEGERTRTCNQLRLFASEILKGKYLDIRVDEAMPDRMPLPRSDLRFQKISLGPVAVFGASNFPLAFSVAGGDTASALAAGSPVVVKAHSAHPGTSELVALAVQEAAKSTGMPEGVFSMIYGSGSIVGAALVNNDHIKAVGFTGSRTAGNALTQLANARKEPIPVYAEMSSINPVYILPKALERDSEAIAEKLISALSMGAGQFCTSPGLVLAVDGDGFDEFIRKAKSIVEESTSQTMLTKGIHRAFQKGVDKFKDNPVVSIIGEGLLVEGESQCSPVLFQADALDFIAQKDLSDEVFGSATLILRCKDFDEMLKVTDYLEGQLTGAIHMQEGDEQLAGILLKELELKVGRILFNGFGTGVEVCSSMVHGGPYPATSNSRSTSVGTAAIDRFLRPVCYQDVPRELLPESLDI